jgi:hypothetical protein
MLMSFMIIRNHAFALFTLLDWLEEQRQKIQPQPAGEASRF